MRDKIIKPFFLAFLFLIIVLILGFLNSTPEGLCQCWVVDSPTCFSCFEDAGAWNPFAGYIQVVGIQTVGTQESCGIANGGKPFYQMVIGCNSFAGADAMSHLLSLLPIFKRQAWCSETIAYWHREAGIPYSGGYSTWWHSDWSLRSVSQLATWYKIDQRGRWISWDDLSYSDYSLGVTVPVPGAYVATRGFTGQFLTFPVLTPMWHDFNDSHSQMINEMWVYLNSEGKVTRIRVTLLEGNSDNRVRFDRSWDDLISLIPGGPDWVQDDRKIYGFGIDLNSSGQPIYDPSRLHIVYQATFTPVQLVRPLTVVDFEWDTYIAPLIPELKSYATTVERNNGPNINSSSGLVNTQGIPNGKNTQWYFPSRLSDEVVIDIDLLDEHPIPIKGVVLNWNAGYLPQDYQIQFLDNTGLLKDANVPDTSILNIQDDPNVFISVPATFSSGQAAQKIRYLKMIFPENTFENDAILEEMRFIYDWDLWEDSEDHPDSKKRTISMSLPAGWSMMSLHVKPDDASVSALFPDAVVIYGYEKGKGYVRIKNEEDLEVGRGYWILLNEEKTSIITGEIIEEYNITLQDGWYMIGGCTSEAQALMEDDGEIRVIYGFKQDSGYQRVLDTEKLQPGKGYWILLENINDYTKLSVQGRTDCRSCSTVPYVSHHGMSSSTYQDKFDEYVSKGYRLTYVSGYEVSGSARFAAIWEKKSGPSWMAHHNMSSSTYQSKFDEYKELGYRLIHVSGYTVDGTPRFAAIWEKRTGPPMIARHNMSSSTYQSEFDDYKSQGYRLNHVSGYSSNSGSLFAAIWEKEPGPPWQARHDLSSSEYQSEFDDLADLGYKLSHVSGYTVNGTPRFAAIWEKISGRYAARHGLSSTNYQNEFENFKYQGYRLLKVSGYSQGGEARYAALWKSLGMKSSDLNLINDTVRPFMDEANVPGLSIAIVKDSRLVFAKGFGYADEETNEKTSPKHLFRIASISKPITSTAIMKLFEEGELDSYSAQNPSAVDGLDALAFGPSGILTEYSGFGRGSYLWEVTVRHLLEHTSGAWGRNFPDPNNYTDPMSHEKHLDHYDLITYVLSNTENFGGTAGKIWQQAQPGTVYSYSNFGYCVLGRVIEKITGVDYDEYVKDNILDECGITKMQIAGNDEADRVDKEVKYYAGPDNIQPYGTMNVTRMDSHGGWIASAIDLARFIVRVDDLQGKDDILSQTTLQEMLTADTVGGSYAKGWRIEKVDGSPDVNKWRHSGSLPGSGSRMVRYYNGFSWAIIMNTRVADEYNGGFRDIPYTIIDNVSSWPSYDLF